MTIGKITMILFALVTVPLLCSADAPQTQPFKIIVINKTNSIANGQTRQITFRRINQPFLALTHRLMPAALQIICALPVQHSCYSFKRNQHRVDFVCQAILQQVNDALRESPDMKVVIYGYRAENEKQGLDSLRATSVRRHLMNNASRPKLKSQQVVIRANGISMDGRQVKMFLVPMDVDLP